MVTDFNCPKGELRCLVPWRPWAKKMKVQWEAKKGTGQWGWDREFFEMIPNWALEKHAWLGAGLIWKRVHASSPTDRLKVEDPRKTRERKVPSGPDYRREESVWSFAAVEGSSFGIALG